MKKASFSLALILAFFFFAQVVYKSIWIPLPDKTSPLIFYSSDEVSLKTLVLRSLEKAKKRIQLSSYALTDENVISALYSKKNLEIQIITDHKTLPKTMTPFCKPLCWELKKTRGLMHEKILLIDEDLSFLGSANMTYESLKIHQNLIVGIYDNTLTNALKTNAFGMEEFILADKTKALFCRLPCKKEKPELKLIELIDQAQNSIEIAMFTLTHKQLIEHLILAKDRGVKVQIYLDKTSANGASKKATEALGLEKIPIFTNVGAELLHHKMMLIDNSTLAIGSANWTNSAFTKNQDFFLILTNITRKNSKTLKKIFRNIKKNTKKLSV